MTEVKKKLKKMVKANLEATEKIVEFLERKPDKPMTPEEQKLWKEKWHAASKRSNALMEDGTQECPCGEKLYLSNFFPSFGDHNFYCETCITDMVALLCKNDSDERRMAERYGEPGELWKRINN
jgi:hypothetical protein